MARHLPETGRIYSGLWFQKDSGPSQQERHGGVAVSMAAGSEGDKCWRLDVKLTCSGSLRSKGDFGSVVLITKYAEPHTNSQVFKKMAMGLLMLLSLGRRGHHTLTCNSNYGSLLPRKCLDLERCRSVKSYLKPGLHDPASMRSSPIMVGLCGDDTVWGSPTLPISQETH